MPRNGIDQLGRAVWLYLHLIRIANHRGIVMRTVDQLASELVLPNATVEEWLQRLDDAKLIHLESPAPFLVIKLPFWSGNGVPKRENPGPLSVSERAALEVPVSSSKQQPAAAASKQTGEGGAGEGVGMVAEVARSLDAGHEEIRQAIAGLPNEIVLKALLRVKMTPTSQIRKSKLALFRYLLAKFTENPHAH